MQWTIAIPEEAGLSGIIENQWPSMLKKALETSMGDCIEEAFQAREKFVFQKIERDFADSIILTLRNSQVSANYSVRIQKSLSQKGELYPSAELFWKIQRIPPF